MMYENIFFASVFIPVLNELYKPFEVQLPARFTGSQTAKKSIK